MKKKKDLKWRLDRLPTPDEVQGLLNSDIITKAEARGILFNQVDEVDKKDLKEEIKFLRDLVEKLSNNKQTQIIETIREVQKPYWKRDWYEPYMFYCGGNTLVTGGDTNGAVQITSGTQELNFSNISTF